MKKKIFTIICSICFVFSTALFISGCNHEHNHVFGEWQTYSEASCTESAMRYCVCECGETIWEKVGEPLGHSYDYWVTITAKSCVNNEMLKGTCTRCGQTEVKVGELATGHKESEEWVIDEDSTCTKTGSKHKECSVCGITLSSDVIPCKAHNMTEWVEVRPATCTTAQVLEHHCTTCSTQNETKDGEPAFGHSEGEEWIIDEDSTCTKTGIKHKECSVCGITLSSDVISCKAHNMTEWVEVRPATCTTAQVLEHHCTTCSTQNETKDGEPAFGHSESEEWIIDEDSTCTKTGSKHKKCSVCGITLSTSSIEKKPHEIVDNVVAPTASSSGYTRHTCNNCDYSYDDNISYLLTFTTSITDSLESEGYNAPTLTTTQKIVYKDDLAKNPYRFTDVLENDYYYTKNVSVRYLDYINSDTYNVGSNIIIRGSSKITVNIYGLKRYFSKGDGTESSPYEISNVYQLKDLADTSPTQAKYYIQTKDIDLNGINWVPIGAKNDNNSFYGCYDGQNHSISNMTINETGEVGVGLFANINGGRISNLKLADFKITNPSTTIDESQYIGLLSGYACNGSSIYNVQTLGVCGIAISSTYTSRLYIGGLLGYIDECTIDNCLFDGTINVVPYTNETIIGGLVASSITSTIIKSVAHGNINYTQARYNGTTKVAGLIGYMDGGELSNCYSTSEVRFNGLQSDSTSYEYVAGLIAMLDVDYDYDSLTGTTTYYDMFVNDNYYNGDIAIINCSDEYVKKGMLFGYIYANNQKDYYYISNNISVHNSTLPISSVDLSTLTNADNNKTISSEEIRTTIPWLHLNPNIWVIESGKAPKLNFEE
ncbi:MAG: hypothetical protein ACI4L7_01245 [Christensenellales bacterium]